MINSIFFSDQSNVSLFILPQIIGPSRHTMNDFWRMVWQENVYCIVMATNVFEHARVSIGLLEYYSALNYGNCFEKMSIVSYYLELNHHRNMS